ncbi:MAG: PhzF family phenazine biosynthesis protein [Nitrospina sp.]|jgi:trans-2,3-dihydro-3-hydroxyanthranilate isomerase|nr:PhzF family phenazine biosynthesis protein [Nitrospina sp.]
METPFYQVDVFTDRIFGGNPLAVFTNGNSFQEDQLQKVAREMNLSETTFVYPPTRDEADFDVRIFTPSREIPFAGHPTLGTAFVLRRNESVTSDPIRLNFKGGIIPVWAENDKGTMQHPPAKMLHKLNHSESIAKALGLSIDQLDDTLPVQVVSTGFPALLVPVISLKAMQEIVLNLQTLKEVMGPLGIDMIYPFCRETVHTQNTVHSRAFAPSLGISEDPATGSVAGAMGAYWASLEKSNADLTMTIEQGYEMERPSLINVEISKQEGEAQQIRVGGQTQAVFTGMMLL